MLRASIVVACVAFITSVPAIAEQPFREGLTPNLTFGMQFGGAESRSDSPAHFTAQFDVRSSLVHTNPESLLAAVRGQPVDLIAPPKGASLLTVFQFGMNAKALDQVRVLGHDLVNTRAQLNESGESAANEHSWLWYTLGGVAAVAGVALAAGSGHSSSSDSAAKSASTSSSSQCNAASGNVGPANIPATGSVPCKP